MAVKRKLLPGRDVVIRWSDKLRGVRRVHYLHIGKTGGTAVTSALRQAADEGTRFLIHDHETGLSKIPRGEACVFFVRDPISRFISGFFSRQRQGRPRYNNPWTAAEAKAFERFGTPNELALALCGDDQELRAAAAEAMRSVLHLRHSYWHWLQDEGYLAERRSDILFVGSQEHLARDLESLSQKLGIPLSLPTDEVSSHRTPEPFKRRGDLEQAAVRSLLQWYRADYACLELLRRLFPHLPDYNAIAAARLAAEPQKVLAMGHMAAPRLTTVGPSASASFTSPAGPKPRRTSQSPKGT